MVNNSHCSTKDFTFEEAWVIKVFEQEDMVLSNVTIYRNSADSSVSALTEVNLRIQAGEWVSIVGPNGSGKSTLAQLLTGVMMTHSGSLERGFAGKQAIPYVMQQDQFFGETPWEDLVFLLEVRGAEPDRIEEITQNALNGVGLGRLMHQPFAELSGGQKQLAAIAGCLAAEAPLILFDEATSMLDSSSRRLVLEAARTLNRMGTTVIWMTHHMEEAAEHERTVALQSGCVVFDGRTVDFFYGEQDDHDEASKTRATPCEQLGFIPPYPVQVARELIQLQLKLPSLPLTAEQLVEAVQCHVK
jgi:energy-coupling factor transport system ATP-binding protein